MDFEEFKELMKRNYESVNKGSIFKMEMPNDEELLKLFLAGIVFNEYERKMNEKLKQRR